MFDGAQLPLVADGLATDGIPDGASGTSGGAGSARTTASRVSRLLSPQDPLPAPLRALVLAGCLLLLAVPTALLIVPGLLG
ncbi:hypothetical protein D3C84_1214700 [compost metagenome]